MKKLLSAALLALVIAGCGEKNAETTPPPAATPEQAQEDSRTESLADYSQGVRDFYGDEIPVGKTGDPEHDIEIEYHQPPQPAEAAVGDTITLTGTNIGVRLEVTVDGVEDAGEHTAVQLKLENTGIAIHDAALRQAALTYADGKTVGPAAARAKCSNRFDDVVRLDVSRTRRGCLLFPKSGDSEPQRFQLALENVPVTAGGIWNRKG